MLERISILCLSLVLVSVWGCSATLRRPSAKEYYQQASDSFTDEDYLGASDQYQELLDQYPLNPYAEEAQLKAAYGLFMEENYAEAVAAFKDFERAYPTSKHMPFVKYFLGITNYSQIRSKDRDQAVTRRADGFFQEVIDRYPESAFVLEAEEKSKSARDILAAHELMVANFNEKRDNLTATKARLRSLIEQYSETDATVEALGRLEQILNEEGNVELAELAARAQSARRAASQAPSVEPPFYSPLLGGTQGGEDEVTGSDGLLVAGVDPLLLLVSELKKQEEAERLARTEADAERLAAEKEAEQEERALDDAFDDDRSYEVGDDYREVDLEALEAERAALETPDIEELEFDVETDDIGPLELTEQDVKREGVLPSARDAGHVSSFSDEDDIDLSDDDILTLDIEDDAIALEEDAEALEAAGVLDAEEEAGDVVEEIATVEDMTSDDEVEGGAEVAEAEPVLSPVEEEAEDDEAVIAVEQSEPVELGESEVEYAEIIDEEAAASDVLTNGDVALSKRGNVSSNDRERLETFPLSGREAVLGIDIEEIDFEFEDE